MMQRAIATASLHGHRYVRLYLTDTDDANILQQSVAAGFDYVFAYSLHDLGDVTGFSRQQKWTQIVRLDRSADDLLASLKQKIRYQINRTYRDADIKVVVDDPDRAASYDFYKDAKESDGVIPDVAEDFTSVRWINAYQGDQFIVATSWFDSGDVLRSHHIVSTRKQHAGSAALTGRLTRRLFWEACVLGVKGGHRYVDLGGLDPNSPEKRGVATFKQSFAGETVCIFVYRCATADWRELSQRALTAGRMVV